MRMLIDFSVLKEYNEKILSRGDKLSSLSSLVDWNAFLPIEHKLCKNKSEQGGHPNARAKLQQKTHEDLHFPMTPEGNLGYGNELIRHFKAWADDHGIALLLNHRVRAILRNRDGEVIGLEASTIDNEVRLRARRAVVFCSGGYTHNPELILQFQHGPLFGGCAAPTNSGDFVLMDGEIRAQLGNMAGAFRAEVVLEQTFRDPNGIHTMFHILGDSILEVNRYGNRDHG